MSRCEGLHCDGCGHGGGRWLVILGAIGAAGTALAALAEDLLIAAGTAVLAALAAVVLLAARALRRGWRPSLNPVVAWNPYTPVESRHAGALPAPQTVIVNIYGTPTPGQLAEVAAIRQAGYQALPDREGR